MPMIMIDTYLLETQWLYSSIFCEVMACFNPDFWGVLSCRDTEITRCWEFYAPVNSLFLSRFTVPTDVQIKSTFRLKTRDFSSHSVSCNTTGVQAEQTTSQSDTALMKTSTPALTPRTGHGGAAWGQGMFPWGHCCSSSSTDHHLTSGCSQSDGWTSPPRCQWLMMAHSPHGGLANLSAGNCLLPWIKIAPT